jgi:hypothetical protein
VAPSVHVAQLASQGSWHALQVELSVLEVYNEQLHDLLARGVTSAAAATLPILHDPLVGPYCPAAVRQPLFSSEQAARVLATASTARAVLAAARGVDCSRCHTVYQFRLARTFTPAAKAQHGLLGAAFEAELNAKVRLLVVQIVAESGASERVLRCCASSREVTGRLTQ